MKLRIVSYAINGRGVGHLVRQLSILRWIRRLCSVLDVSVETWVLTSSEADTLARREGVPAIKMPSKAMLRDAKINPTRYLRIARGWTLQAITSLSPDILIVDTFPSGSFGELLAVLEMVQTRVLVARRVREDFAADDGYRSMLSFYQKVIHPDASGVGPIMIREKEELHTRERARTALGIPVEATVLYLSLGGGGDVNAADLLPKMVRALLEKDFYIVVGAGPLYQGEEIRGDRIRWMTRYVPLELMQGFDLAISAGGYNSFHELMYAQVPTIFFPQSRIADDQKERVMRAVKAGAGKYASNWREAVSMTDNPGSRMACASLVESNGAKKAAIEVLSTHISTDRLHKASEIFSSDTLLFLSRFPPNSPALDLFRIFTPARPVLASHQVLPQKEQCERLLQLFQRSGTELDTFLYVSQSLMKKFPLSSSDDLLTASEILFDSWAPFDDWMGVSSLLRAIPTQRNFAILRFAAAMKAWLATEDDLFDALRAFSKREGNGKRTVAEVLHQLTHGDRDA